MSATDLLQQYDAIFLASTMEAKNIDYDKKLAESEGKEKFRDKVRAAAYKQHLHALVVIGIWIIGPIIILLILIRAWHLVTPGSWKWLGDGTLHSIDAVLFSSVIFSLASRYFSYYNLFQKSPKDE